MSRRRKLVLVLAIGGLLVALAGGLIAWDVRRTWSELDRAADRFNAPDGFEVIGRTRQGTALCFVTCSGGSGSGGEAIVTIVFTSDATTPEEACRALRPAVADVASRVQDLSWDEVCAVQGDLDGESSVRMVSARREDLSGFRWTESLPTPESQVVSFVEFTAGLE